MQSGQRSTVVGVFEDRAQADQAVHQLREAGFLDDQIGVAVRHDTDLSGGVSDTGTEEGTHAGTGAAAGAVAGLGLGALAGLGVMAGVIPVIGPAIAAGTLGVILSNAAAGAGIAGLVGALIGAGIPEHEADYYRGEFESGRTLVTVRADGRADEASAILRRFGGYDIESRAGDVSASPAAESAARTGTGTGTAGDTMQLKEEQLHAEAHPVETGEVRAHKEVHTENRTIDVPVQREEVVIERTPVHGEAAEGISDAGREGEEIRIPVREDQVDVSKHAVVTEEVKVGKQAVPDTKRVSGQVRKEELKVERSGDVDVRGDAPGHKGS